MKFFTSISITALIIVSAGTSFAQVPTAERDALLALYNSTDGANWSNTTGWWDNAWVGAVGTECTWFGVTCESGNVTRLTLTSNLLTGNIPAELGNLTSLTRLELSGNSLNGTIPSELGNLNSLKVLNLSNNSFTGVFPESIQLLTVNDLQEFNIDNNSFSRPRQPWLLALNVNDSAWLSAVSPTAAIAGGARTIADTDNAAGESISFTGTATDTDGTIATTEWLVGGAVVSTVLNPTIFLQDGITVVNFKVTDDDGETTTTSVTITVQAPSTTTTNEPAASLNISPLVSIASGSPSVVLDRYTVISATGEQPGKSITLAGIATDTDGVIASTTWDIIGPSILNADGVTFSNPTKVVLNDTGLEATISLAYGKTDASFTATDSDGASTTTTVTITVEDVSYKPTTQWPSPYNGATPSTALGIEFNNIGVLTSSGIFHTCIKMFVGDTPTTFNGMAQIDIDLELKLTTPVIARINQFREFNTGQALNEDGMEPDCSGKYDATSGLYTDFLLNGTAAYAVTFELFNSEKLTFKLKEYKQVGSL